jgi:hypothetical protein
MGGNRNEVRYSVVGEQDAARTVAIYLRLGNPQDRGALGVTAEELGRLAARRLHISLTPDETYFLRTVNDRSPKERIAEGVHISMTAYVGGEYEVEFSSPFIAKAC